MSLIMAEHFQDTYRWWAAGGAFLGFWPVLQWVRLHATGREPHDGGSMTMLLLALSWLVILSAIFLLGLFIPLATDHRVAFLAHNEMALNGGLVTGWLLLGLGSWGVAIACAANRWTMAGASVAAWLALFAAAYGTHGAML